MSAEKFTLTRDHIKLIRHMYVSWWDCETGAPAIDPKRPYGNSDVACDIAKIVGRELELNMGAEDYSDPQVERELLALHAETQTALQIVLTCETFEPGVFELEHKYMQRSWKRVSF